MQIEIARVDCRLHVEVDGRALTPARSQQVWNHSPDGFECGYAGSGPAQLALAILLEAGLGSTLAVELHQRFKADYVQHWEAPMRELVDIDGWVAHQA